MVSSNRDSSYLESNGMSDDVKMCVPSVLVAKFFSNPFASISLVLIMQPALLMRTSREFCVLTNSLPN